MKRRFIYMGMIFLAAFLLVPLHLDYSFGDQLFRMFGISPRTHGEDGFNLTVILSLILSVWGIKGVLKYYRPEQRIMRRIALGCIILVVLLPTIVEKATFLLKHNTTGLSSIGYSKKKSNCSYQPVEQQIKANCSFTLYNYGNLTNITIKPVLKDNRNDIQFEPVEISISPHSRVTLGMPFLAKQGNGTGYSGGSTNKMDVVIALP